MINNLLLEWENYEKKAAELPSRILRKEQKSIARALKKMKEDNEYHNVSQEDKQKIEKIVKLFEKGKLD